MWRENEAAQDDGRTEQSLGAKTSSREQGPDFNLVGTSRNVVIRETREVVHTTCCQVLPLHGVYRFESP
jgi:hypothetical protein